MTFSNNLSVSDCENPGKGRMGGFASLSTSIFLISPTAVPRLSESLGNHNQDILQIGSLESVGEFSLCAWLLFSENEPAISDGKPVSGE